MEAALVLRDIRKTFGSTIAVDSLDLVVPAGALYGLIGPSGAGKTTCMRLIMSILFPDAGELAVLGRPSAVEAKHRIGYLPEERGVYRKMKVAAFLTYIGQLKGLRAGEARARASSLLERLGLAGAERKRCEELSKGMLQRVQFVATVINDPDLLIFDEPFSGLDPVTVRLLTDVIQELHRRGKTILFSTHVMAHAEQMCQHVVMLHRGRKVLDEPMAGLQRRYNRRVIRFEPLDPGVDVTPLGALPGVLRTRPSGDGLEIHLAEGMDPGAAIRLIAGTVPAARVELSRVRLEDVFVRLVAGDTRSEEAERALRADLQGLDAEGMIA
jgi:ABC-2 type transport system ATP-binding protein